MGPVMETRVNSEVWEKYPRERQRESERTAHGRGEIRYGNLFIERETV
jgi:hypothetical protein